MKHEGCAKYLSLSLLILALALTALVAPTLSAGNHDLASCEPAKAPCLRREAKILFTSTRDNPPPANPLVVGEIYMMNPDGTNPIRLTENTGGGNAFAALSPDGKKIVFDSNRLRSAGEAADLFVMTTDGSEQTLVTRGSSATWAPNTKYIAFHASASGTGLPIRPDPGAPTSDSDIFVLNLDNSLAHGAPPVNITNSPSTVDDDPDWSPDGQWIAFTRHPAGFPGLAEIFLIRADGTGEVQQVTNSGDEPRGPVWSPDGTRIAFICRRGSNATYEICVINADGSEQQQLTVNTVLDATPTWSSDGQKIAFHRPVAGRFQLFVMDADGSNQMQLTNTLGINAFASWGEVLIPGRRAEP